MISPPVFGSFRDPAGHIFQEDGCIYRQVNPICREPYDALMTTGLYQSLTDARLLVRHDEVRDMDRPGAYKILRPELIDFISYPYEWSFNQLKDAALLTLSLQKQALQFGLELKDASAFNIQFHNVAPILIDTLSFQMNREGQPWGAYGQFCRHFLAPLALASYNITAANHLYRGCIDGIPLECASDLLPIRSKLKPSLLIHVHLHSKLQKKFADKPDAKTKRAKRFTLRALLGLIDSLEGAINSLHLKDQKTEWSDYQGCDSYEDEGFEDKVELVSEFLDRVKPDNMWDLGANTGTFSRLSGERGVQTISFDFDPIAVDMNYRSLKKDNYNNVLPLVMDLTNPSPSIGWDNNERMSLNDRGPVDMILALALIHHLVIGNNISFSMVASYLAKLCKWTVIEFVPKNDPQVRRLLATREDVFAQYDEESFQKDFRKCFDIEDVKKISNSERTLYLLKVK